MVSFLATAMTSCSDKPDDENYYTFTGQMMSEYIKSNPQFSDFATIVERAGLMDQLSAYGHYTCFLPTNDAIRDYLQAKNKTIDALSAADCDTIARTHLMTEMYSTSDMPDGMLPTQNMLRRNVNIENTTDDDNNAIVKLNSNSVIAFGHQNDSVENGIVHVIDAVLENSTKGLGSLIQLNEKVSIYASAIKMTGLDLKLDSIEDLDYARDVKDNPEKYAKEALATGSRAKEDVVYPEHKMYGFTAFLVPDAVLKSKYNIENVQQLYNKACEIYDPIYPEDVNIPEHEFANITSPKNPLYRFIAYHLLDRNVQGYNFLTVREDAGIDKDVVNPTDWYTTILPHTMIKVEHLTVSKWQGATGVLGDWYVNRRYDDEYFLPGIHIQPSIDSEYDNNAVNGIYFYADDIFAFDKQVVDNVFNTRIRMDFSTLFPEIMSNNIRMNGPSVTDSNVGVNYRFPDGYLKGVKLTGDSRLIYWYAKPGYYSMNGDEMDAQGVFDITFVLPPVPFTGEWQIRLGFAPMNIKDDGANYRGQVQVYLDGKAQGIPLDFSKILSDVFGVAKSNLPSFLTLLDSGHEEELREDYKILKNQGYYRGPHSVFNSSSGKIGGKYNYFSQMANTVRKVLCTSNMEAGVQHTLRIKNVSQGLTARNKEAMLDYIELVPKSVYAVDGDATEDIY